MSINVSASLSGVKAPNVSIHEFGVVTLSWGSPLVIAMQREAAIELARAIIAALPEAAE